MDWMEEVKTRLGRKNQVLFSKDSPCLQDLRLLLQDQDRRLLILWALDFAEESAADLKEKYPEETRPEEALQAARDWASGRIKMPLARRKILDCHAFAKEINCKEDIAACHAVGQACSVVHTAGHAMGYPIYDLTSLIYHYGIESCREPAEARMAEYISRLLFWQKAFPDYKGEWAGFLQKK